MKTPQRWRIFLANRFSGRCQIDWLSRPMTQPAEAVSEIDGFVMLDGREGVVVVM